MLSATSSGGVVSAGGERSVGPENDNEESDMLRTEHLEVTYNCRKRAECGSESTEGQLVDDEVIDEKKLVMGTTGLRT